MNPKKPIAIFDIDGTVYRSSLLIELNALLVKRGVFQATAKDKVLRVRKAWLDRKGTYNEYIDTIVQLYVEDIKGVAVKDVVAVSKELIKFQKDRVYVFTRDLIKDLRHTHNLVIISFSPTEVVHEFNKYYDFDIVSGLDYVHKNGVYTGEVTQGTKLSKRVILEDIVERFGLSLKYSVGIGDSISDVEFLKMVDRPIAFNPSKKLYDTAVKQGWEVVVERKNVVYRI